MKALTCVICSTRTWQVTWDNFRTHLLQVTGSDLCLSIGVSQGYDFNNPLFDNAKYKFLYPEPADYGHAFDAACAMSGATPKWRQLLKIQDIWLGGIEDPKYQQISGSAIPIFYRWWLCNNLRMHGLLDKYDWFIMTRSDNFFEYDHVKLSELDPDYIYMPESEDYGGIQDRHIVVSKKLVLAALDIADPMIHHADDTFDGLYPLQPINIERYQKYVYDCRGLTGRIVRFPRMMYLVKGAADSSRWSHGVFEPRCNKIIKYHSEFELVWANKHKTLMPVMSRVPIMRPDI